MNEPSGDGDLQKTLVRLIAGGIGEGIDLLKTLSAQLDTAEVDAAPETSGPYPTNPAAMVLVGWTSEMPEQLVGASAAVSRMAYPMTRVARVVYDTGAYLAETIGIAPFVAELTLPTRQAIGEEIERLASVGSAEYARGRVLAVEAFTQSVDGIVGYLGQSDELGELVREQTLGITGAAVQEIRETGAAADGLTEGIFRRIFGKDIRALPPKPALEGE